MPLDSCSKRRAGRSVWRRPDEIVPEEISGASSDGLKLDDVIIELLFRVKPYDTIGVGPDTPWHSECIPDVQHGKLSATIVLPRLESGTARAGIGGFPKGHPPFIHIIISIYRKMYISYFTQQSMEKVHTLTDNLGSWKDDKREIGFIRAAIIIDDALAISEDGTLACIVEI